MKKDCPLCKKKIRQMRPMGSKRKKVWCPTCDKNKMNPVNKKWGRMSVTLAEIKKEFEKATGE